MATISPDGTRLVNTDLGVIGFQFFKVSVPSTNWLTEYMSYSIEEPNLINASILGSVSSNVLYSPMVQYEEYDIFNSSTVYISQIGVREISVYTNSVNYVSANLGNNFSVVGYVLEFSDDVWCFILSSVSTPSSPGYPATESAFGLYCPSSLSGSFSPVDNTTLSKLSTIGNALKSAIEIKPYDDIPPAESGGGIGTYDFTTSDDVDYPSLPILSAVSTGFVSLWSPTVDQMLRLSSFMWNADILTTDFWKKLIANPMELIYGLSLVPLNLSNLGYIDGEGTVVVGLINTGISMNHLSSQWVLFDCGSVTIDETWGAYLDYDPYTKLEIYLPFCGVHPLKVDDFMPGVISLKYYIDLLSGTCIAVVKSTKSNQHGDVLDSVVYQFMGNCSAQIPVTAQQFADAVRSAINIAASIGSMVATGVGGAAAASGAKNAAGGISTTARTVSQEISTGSSMVENVMNLKPAIERSGAIGSAGSLLSVRSPYLILTRPRMARPESQNVYTGYPSFITETLGDLKGWTIVQAIHLDNIPCTADEMNEIDELLKGGVIF